MVVDFLMWMEDTDGVMRVANPNWVSLTPNVGGKVGVFPHVTPISNHYPRWARIAMSSVYSK